MAGTPYDDVFRTLVNDCSGLVLPVLNEAFGEHYSGQEEVLFYPNEHFLKQQDGSEEKRITDSCFTVLGQKPKKYHLECQSTEDSTILVRIFEYDAQIALDDGRVEKNVLEVTFPHSAVLSLRAKEDAMDSMTMRIKTPEGRMEYRVPVVKAHSYGVEEIFEKNLLFLIPFHLFTHEKELGKCDKDEKLLGKLIAEYVDIRNRLEELCEADELDEFTYYTILEMSNRVLEHLAAKQDRVREGVKAVMVGRVLEHEAKTIRNQGRAEGQKRGDLLRLICQVQKKCQKGKSVEEMADDLEEQVINIQPIADIIFTHADASSEEVLEILFPGSNAY